MFATQRTFAPYVEQFISDLTIEAFDVAVLPGAADGLRRPHRIRVGDPT